LDFTAAFLQQLPKCITDQGEQNDTPVRLDPGDDPIDLAARPHHAPNMLDRLRSVELHKAGSGHRMDGFSRRIGNEMEVKSRHRVKPSVSTSTRSADYDEGKMGWHLPSSTFPGGNVHHSIIVWVKSAPRCSLLDRSPFCRSCSAVWPS
jgi:hypothetical protein